MRALYKSDKSLEHQLKYFSIFMTSSIVCVCFACEDE